MHKYIITPETSYEALWRPIFFISMIEFCLLVFFLFPSSRFQRNELNNNNIVATNLLCVSKRARKSASLSTKLFRRLFCFFLRHSVTSKNLSTGYELRVSCLMVTDGSARAVLYAGRSHHRSFWRDA